MKLVQATIKYPPGKVFPSKYGKGDRQNIVVELPDQSEATIWFPANHQNYVDLRRGERRQFTLDSKGELRLIEEVSPAETPIAQNPTNELTPDRKREIAGYEGIDSEGIRAIATSLFIATQRKFSL